MPPTWAQKMAADAGGGGFTKTARMRKQYDFGDRRKTDDNPFSDASDTEPVPRAASVRSRTPAAQRSPQRPSQPPPPSGPRGSSWAAGAERLARQRAGEPEPQRPPAEPPGGSSWAANAERLARQRAGEPEPQRPPAEASRAAQGRGGPTWAQKWSDAAGGGGFTRDARRNKNFAAAGRKAGPDDDPFGEDLDVSRLRAAARSPGGQAARNLPPEIHSEPTWIPAPAPARQPMLSALAPQVTQPPPPPQVQQPPPPAHVQQPKQSSLRNHPQQGGQAVTSELPPSAASQLQPMAAAPQPAQQTAFGGFGGFAGFGGWDDPVHHVPPPAPVRNEASRAGSPKPATENGIIEPPTQQAPAANGCNEAAMAQNEAERQARNQGLSLQASFSKGPWNLPAVDAAHFGSAENVVPAAPQTRPPWQDTQAVGNGSSQINHPRKEVRLNANSESSGWEEATNKLLHPEMSQMAQQPVRQTQPMHQPSQPIKFQPEPPPARGNASTSDGTAAELPMQLTPDLPRPTQPFNPRSTGTFQQNLLADLSIEASGKRFAHCGLCRSDIDPQFLEHTSGEQHRRAVDAIQGYHLSDFEEALKLAAAAITAVPLAADLQHPAQTPPYLATKTAQTGENITEQPANAMSGPSDALHRTAQMQSPASQPDVSSQRPAQQLAGNHVLEGTIPVQDGTGLSHRSKKLDDEFLASLLGNLSF